MAAGNKYNPNNPYGLDANIHLDPNDFNKLIAQHGIRVLIEKANICPNWIGKANKMQHDVQCTLCDNGFIHYGGMECWAFFQQNQLVKMFLREGIFDPGQATLTIPTHNDDGKRILLNYFDQITLLDQDERFYELLNKSRGNMDLLRYQALEVEDVTDSTGAKYIENANFILDKNGNMEWLPDQKRPIWDTSKGVGQTFSVTYRFRPVYRVTQLLHEGRYSNRLMADHKMTVKFPQLVLMKKDYYIKKIDVENGLKMQQPVIQEFWDYDVEIEPGDI